MEKAALKYWLITRSALTATDADRKCFVTTAGCAAATKQRNKMCLWITIGTPELSSGAARYPEFTERYLLVLNFKFKDNPI